MITYQKESFKDMCDSSGSYFKKHHEEVESYVEELPLDLDLDLYNLLEENYSLLCYTAREGEELIGYLCYVVNPQLHFKGCYSAQCDNFYIDPEYRGRKVSYDLMCFAEDDLCTLDIQTVMMNMKTKAMFEGLMQALNYDRSEVVYTKFIGNT